MIVGGNYHIKQLILSKNSKLIIKSKTYLISIFYYYNCIIMLHCKPAMSFENVQLMILQTKLPVNFEGEIQLGLN